jgi:hypothetical protein
MTSVKLNRHFKYVQIMNLTDMYNYLAYDMSKSDVRKIRHSERFTLGVSSPKNVKSPEVPKDEGLKLLSIVDLRYI